MTPRRAEAMQRAAQGHSESAQRLMRLVGIDPVLE